MTENALAISQATRCFFELPMSAGDMGSTKPDVACLTPGGRPVTLPTPSLNPFAAIPRMISSLCLMESGWPSLMFSLVPRPTTKHKRSTRRHRWSVLCITWPYLNADEQRRRSPLEEVRLGFRGFRRLRHAIETVGWSDVAPTAFGPCR